MYLPEDDSQMFEILTGLRVYAEVNALPALAEELDDAIVVLASELRRNGRRKAAATFADDRR